MKYRIRYNTRAGEPSRGSVDHKWRVFDENNKEYICKEVWIQVPSWTQQDPNNKDWNIECIGTMKIDKQNSVIEII
jgi:hypothetical protein